MGQDDLARENENLKKAVIALNQHIGIMQVHMREHLRPDGGLRRPEDFISQIIYDLDGPEQRAVQRLAADKLGA